MSEEKEVVSCRKGRLIAFCILCISASPVVVYFCQLRDTSLWRTAHLRGSEWSATTTREGRWNCCLEVLRVWSSMCGLASSFTLLFSLSRKTGFLTNPLRHLNFFLQGYTPQKNVRCLLPFKIWRKFLPKKFIHWFLLNVFWESPTPFMHVCVYACAVAAASLSELHWPAV